MHNSNAFENGFDNAMNEAKKIALEMKIEPIFPTKRKINRKNFI